MWVYLFNLFRTLFLVTPFFDFFIVKDHKVRKVRRCRDLVMGEIPEAEARTTPADVTKAEANEPSEFMLCGHLVLTVD